MNPMAAFGSHGLWAMRWATWLAIRQGDGVTVDTERDSWRREFGSTEIYTYVLLFEASAVGLDCARNDPGKEFHHCLHSIISAAFGLEAYLNDLGGRVFSFWPNLRWLRTRDKLQVICTHLGFGPDFSQRPYQAFAQAFAARDLAAHAETETLKFDRGGASREELPKREASRLESECKLAKAKRILEDAMELVRDIHKRAGIKFDPFMKVSHTSWTRM